MNTAAIRGSLESWTRRWWRGEGGVVGAVLSIGMLPLEGVTRAVVGSRRRRYESNEAKVERGPIPVISVGNLSVGGTGKTPFVGWLASMLEREGHRPAVVSGGYGKDELALHRLWNPGVPVLTARKRLEGVREAYRSGCEVALLDDGFQHRALHRDLDIVLLSAEETDRERLIPRGPYREPFSALARADLAVLVRRIASVDQSAGWIRRIAASAPGLPVLQMDLVLAGGSYLNGEGTEPPKGALLAVAGVGDPTSFERMVRDALGADVESLVFPDHHDYTMSDVNDIIRLAAGRTVVTTEKDAVKLRMIVGRVSPDRSPEIWVARLEPRFPSGTESFIEAIRAVVRGEAA